MTTLDRGNDVGKDVGYCLIFDPRSSPQIMCLLPRTNLLLLPIGQITMFMRTMQSNFVYSRMR